MLDCGSLVHTRTILIGPFALWYLRATTQHRAPLVKGSRSILLQTPHSKDLKTMSERSVRKSTQELRQCFAKNSKAKAKRYATLEHRRRRTVSVDHRSEESEMSEGAGDATAQPALPEAGQWPNGQPQVPVVPQQLGQNGQQPVVPQHAAGDPPHSPPPTAREKGYEDRISKLEELLKNKNSRSKSRSKSRSSGRSSRASAKSSRHRSRSKARKSARTTRSRSRSRSRSRHSARSRHRSRSGDTRKTRSRSDARRRSRRGSRHRSRSRSASRSSSYRQRRRRSASRRRRSPNAARREADRAVESQFPDMGHGKGEPLPITGLPLEPYYNLPPDLRIKAKARRSRRDMTFPEYVCGMLNMIAKATPPKSEIHSAITHVAQVAQDAAGYTWSAVREWSQACLTYIADGKDKWVHETDLFARERTRLSWIKGKPPQEVRVPCQPHNADKCEERATHYSEGKTWVHGCGVCVYASSDDMGLQAACTHNVRTCRKKASLRYAGDDGRSDQRRRNNHYNYKKEGRPEQTKSKN